MNQKTWTYFVILAMTTAMLSTFPTVGKAITFGDALGVGAGLLLFNRPKDNYQQKGRYIVFTNKI